MAKVKWNVEATVSYSVSTSVEAKTEEEAKKKAEELLGELLISPPEGIDCIDTDSPESVDVYSIEAE